jgi:tRNA nucleotidyltransferase (CCA-adding enzyme)
MVQTAEQRIDALRALKCGARVLDVLGNADDVWVVGGATRDLLLGHEPREIDLVTTKSAIEIGERLGELRESHDRFGTVKAADGLCLFDIARTRTETYESAGALPDVMLGNSLEEDLRRRDFTINAIAMTLDGALIEYPGARGDLQAGVMRVLHDKSFEDDPTRLWRLVRYSVRLGFGIEAHTNDLAAAAVAGGALATVSGDRVGAELKLALREPDPMASLHAAYNLGLIPALNLDPELIGQALEILPSDGRADLLILASALEDIEWIAGLGFTAAELGILLSATTVSPAPKGPPSAVAESLRGLPNEAVALAGARGDREAAERWLLEWQNVELEIDGDDLIAAGVEPGPEIGERLRRTLDLKLDGKLRNRGEELAEALR